MRAAVAASHVRAATVLCALDVRYGVEVSVMRRSIAEIIAFISEVERVAGPDTAATVVGESVVDSSSKPKDRALWLAAAIERLRQCVDQASYEEIMHGCGAQCACRHRADKTALQRRRQHPSLDAFLAEEQRNPPPGTRLIVEETAVYQHYLPVEAKGGYRCFCPVMRHLPKAVSPPAGYCECSRSYLEQAWSAILGQAADVEVVESCLTGAQECVFRIALPK